MVTMKLHIFKHSSDRPSRRRWWSCWSVQCDPSWSFEQISGREREKVVPDRTNSAWIDEAVIRAKQARLRAERKKRKTNLVVHIQHYKQAINNVNKAIKHAKAGHFRVKLEEAASDSKKMFSLLSTLLNRQDRSDYLPKMKPQEAAESFSRFFNDKTEKMRPGFVDGPSQKSDAKEHLVSTVPPAHMFSCFHALSGDQILKLIHASKPTTADVDSVWTEIPNWIY